MSARDRFSWSLAWLATLGTALASSDVMPRLLQERWLEPYRLKTLPVLVVWLATQGELWRQNVSAPFQAPPAGGAAPAR